MRLLIVLQAVAAATYYMTAPFALNASIWLMLGINAGALLWLWVTCPHPARQSYKHARTIFTITLLLLEAVIGMTDSPISTTELQGLANDAEVLITGILLGVLWHNLFTTTRPHKTHYD